PSEISCFFAGDPFSESPFLGTSEHDYSMTRLNQTLHDFPKSIGIPPARGGATAGEHAYKRRFNRADRRPFLLSRLVEGEQRNRWLGRCRSSDQQHVGDAPVDRVDLDRIHRIGEQRTAAVAPRASAYWNAGEGYQERGGKRRREQSG